MDKIRRILIRVDFSVRKFTTKYGFDKDEIAMTDNSIRPLADIMNRLRDKETGCKWDCAQTHESIIDNTLEEAYEVCDAVERKDDKALCEELGDLLLHVVFHAKIAQERGAFNFDDVVKCICDKMIRRHPHIFGKADEMPDWEAMKKAERLENHQSRQLDGIARALPASTRAFKLQARAAKVGFDWSDASFVLDKIEEEIAELRAEMNETHSKDGQEAETGDLLFACVNLARKLGINPDKALRRTNEKFERRFSYIEDSLKAQNRALSDASLDEMEDLWGQAKRNGL